MTTFNTGNPVGSTAVKDLSDNAENLDAAINGPGLTWTDRLGVVRESWAGFKVAFDAFIADGSTIEFSTWAEASAAAAANQIPLNRQVAVIGDEGTHVDPVSGLTVSNSGRYVRVAAGLEWRSADVLTQKADRSDVNAIFERVGALDSGASYEAVSGIPTATQVANTDFFGVARAFIPGISVLNHVTGWLVPLAAATKVRVRVYTRANENLVVPGGSIDTLQREVIVDLAPLRSLFVAGGPVPVRADFDTLQVNPSLPIIVSFEALNDSDGYEGTGFYRSATPVGYTQTFVYRSTTGVWVAAGAGVTLSMSGGYELQGEDSQDIVTGHDDLVWVEPNQHSWESTDFAGWARSFTGNEGAAFNAVSAYLSFVDQPDLIEIRVFARPVASASAITLPGNPNVRDLLMKIMRVDTGTIPNAAVTGKFYFDIGEVRIPTGHFPVVQLAGLMADGSKSVLGAGRTNYDSTPPDQTWMLAAGGSAGWVVLGQNNTVSIGIATALTDAVGSVLGRVVNDSLGQQAQIDGLDDRLGVVETRLDNITQNANTEGMGDYFLPSLAVDGLTVDLAGSMATLDGTTVGFSGTVTADAPASGSESIANYNLQYSSLGAGQYPSQNPNSFLLNRRRLSNVVVTRVSDGAVLQLGVDYGIDNRFGKLYGIPNVAAQPVNVDFNYTKERYDLLALDPVSLSPFLVKGEERDRDAHDYSPPSAGIRGIPLFYLYVQAGTITAIPVHKYVDGVRRDTRAVFDALIRTNKARMPRTMRKLSRGEPLTIAGYGDSITNCGGFDLLWFFENMPTDNRARIPTYTREGTPSATRVSWNWVAINAMKAAYGYVDQYEANPDILPVITYVNKGVSSTNSGSANNGGSNPARLADLIASMPDLVVIGFGMNELGSDSTFANMLSIITQLQAAGIEVMVVTTPKKNGITDSTGVAAWQKTNRTLESISQATKVAYTPFHWLLDQGGGGMPVAPEHLCSSNYFNHPGWTELRYYGEMLAKSFV